MIPRLMQPLRLAVQWLYLFFCVYVGIEFARFVAWCRGGGVFVPRPDAVEGFLPISALASLRYWIGTGSVHPVHPAALVIFLSAIAVSLLLRRSFCSWICPVGTISEALWKSGFSLFRKNLRPPRPADILFRGVKYLLLFFFVWSIFFLMSPPALAEFLRSDYHRVADVRLLDFFRNPTGVSLGVILFLLAASVLLRGPFCRYLCPYGALLGLVAFLSPLRIHRDREVCVSCGVCSQVCPSAIDVMRKSTVTSPECVGCWRCASHCRAAGALSMRVVGLRTAVGGILFALLVVGIFWGGSIIGKGTGHWRTITTPAEYRALLSGR